MQPWLFLWFGRQVDLEHSRGRLQCIESMAFKMDFSLFASWRCREGRGWGGGGVGGGQTSPFPIKRRKVLTCQNIPELDCYSFVLPINARLPLTGKIIVNRGLSLVQFWMRLFKSNKWVNQSHFWKNKKNKKKNEKQNKTTNKEKTITTELIMLLSNSIRIIKIKYSVKFELS